MERLLLASAARKSWPSSRTCSSAIRPRAGYGAHLRRAVASPTYRRIRSPLVIFASYGDNITPPHQALGWIPVVYRSTDALKAAGQRIVYLTNPHVGHLGIFVSAAVARLEHRAILEHLAEIEALRAGPL